MKRVIALLVSMFLLVMTPVYAIDQKDIVDTAIENGNFTILVAALEKAGLVETLQGDGPYTVFAPTDEAFGNLLTALDISAEQLLAQPQLAEVLLYHVVDGTVLSTDLEDGNVETLLEGNFVTIDTSGPTVNGANIGPADITASNGVIHVIDEVLIPEGFVLVDFADTVVDIATSSDDFSILVAALTEAGLVETLQGEGPFTVFAPTNDAFEDLLAALDITADDLLASPRLTQVLLYHVVAGNVLSTDLESGEVETILGESVTIDVDALTVNDANLGPVDLRALNGVVHVIDKVLVPEAFFIEFDTVVDIALSSPDFSILVEALVTADLVGALQGDGPFTVFAPTNQAFADLLAALDITKEQLLAQPDLAKVLLYHVISGKVFAEDITDGLEVETLNTGETITFTTGSVFINDTTEVIDTDLEALNGVVHVIDSVLVPSNFTLVVDVDDDDDGEEPAFETVVDVALSSDDFSILVLALQTAGLVDALLGEGPFTVFAPTNAAFEELLEALGITAADLLAQPDLAKVLLYHVIPGMVFSDEIVDGSEVETLNEGQNLVFTLGSVIINGTTLVITADIEAGNGVVHVIDSVLIPSNFTLVPADQLPDTGAANILGWVALLLILGTGLVIVNTPKKREE